MIISCAVISLIKGDDCTDLNQKFYLLNGFIGGCHPRLIAINMTFKTVYISSVSNKYRHLVISNGFVNKTLTDRH